MSTQSPKYVTQQLSSQLNAVHKNLTQTQSQKYTTPPQNTKNSKIHNTKIHNTTTPSRTTTSTTTTRTLQMYQ